MIEIYVNEVIGCFCECPNCGEEIELGDNYCSGCGEPIEWRERYEYI